MVDDLNKTIRVYTLNKSDLQIGSPQINMAADQPGPLRELQFVTIAWAAPLSVPMLFTPGVKADCPNPGSSVVKKSYDELILFCRLQDVTASIKVLNIFI